MKLGFLNEGVSFFKREKKYTLLLVICILAYLFTVFSLPAVEEESSPALEKLKKVETIYEEQGVTQFLEILIQDPEYAFFAIVFNSIFFALFCMGICVCAYVILRLFQRREIIPRTLETESLWGMSDVVKFLILAFAFSLFFGIFSNLLIVFFKLDFAKSGFLLLHASLVDLFAIYIIYHFSRGNHQNPFKNLGLTRKGVLKDIGLGILVYSWALPFFLSIVLLLSYLIKLIQYEPPPHTLIDILVVEDKRSPWLVGYSIFLACAIGPIIEEVFFRGFFFAALKRKWNAFWAIHISAFIFALIHQSLFAILPIYFLGIILAYVREKRGTLTPAITMHILHNSFLLGYFFIIKRGVMDQLV